MIIMIIIIIISVVCRMLFMPAVGKHFYKGIE
jgi:hypothetical protein